MEEHIVRRLAQIVGEEYCVTDQKEKATYLYDEIELTVRPEANKDSVLVKPKTSLEVAEILKLANRHAVPVVVRGGGTGLCGGCIPVLESIVICMERLNAILEIDTVNMVAVLEGGVTLFSLLEELKKHKGIGFPVHPGDEGAQAGGMAVTNAGGARAVRHGVMRRHIMGLEAVLPSGEIISLGGKLIKDNAGYNLMQLVIGSEGTLAVVTKVILRLYPEENYTATIVTSFEQFEDASRAVLDILRSGTLPLAVEYQDKHLFVETARMLGKIWPLEKGAADLMIIISEKTEDDFYDTCQKIYDICTENHAIDSYIAEGRNDQDELLHIRSQHYEYIKHMIGHSFDMAVPVGSIPSFLNDIKRLATEYHTVTNVTAHIADGNIHNDIVLVDGKMPDYAEELKEKLYKLCFEYGGTITGEHGIGKLRVEDLCLQKSEAEMLLMRGIKKLFDPMGILNPGTVVSAEVQTL